MASCSDVTKEKEFVFTWVIENFPHCLHETGEWLKSPTFIVDAFQGTKWHLRLYPKGRCDERFISCDLCREDSDNGPDTIFIDGAEHAFIAVDGSPKQADGLSQISFTRGGKGTFHSSMFRAEALTEKRSILMPRDSLTVRCRMWQKSSSEQVYCNARTRIDAEKTTFVWALENLCRGRWSKKSTEIRAASSESSHMKIDFSLINGTNGEDLQLLFEVAPLNNKIMETSTFKIDLMDSDGNTTLFAKSEISGHSLSKGHTWRFHPIQKWKNLLRKNELYLPNDVMTLKCELVTSDGMITLNVIEETFHTSICRLPGQKGTGKVSPVNKEDRLMANLRLMLDDGVLCDTKLKTQTKTFSAHKLILGARSQVFRSMFLADMQEKSGDSVDISDLEDDTVERMLVYAYTGKVGELDWECATKLYYAADKYEMLFLREECSTFLIEKLTPKNACEVLAMTDMHQDVNLKNHVQEFISKHYTEVLHSDEWRDLEKKNFEIAIEMLRKICFK